MCRDGDVELRRRLHAPHRVVVRPRREREQHARDGVVTPRSSPRPVVGRQVIQPHDSPCLDAARSGAFPGRPTRGEVKGTRVRTFNWWLELCDVIADGGQQARGQENIAYLRLTTNSALVFSLALQQLALV